MTDQQEREAFGKWCVEEVKTPDYPTFNIFRAGRASMQAEVDELNVLKSHVKVLMSLFDEGFNSDSHHDLIEWEERAKIAIRAIKQAMEVVK